MIALWLALALQASAQTDGATWEANPGMLRLGGMVLFFGGEGPLSYQLPAAGSAPAGAKPVGEVFGSSCQYGLSVPLALAPRATRLAAGRGLGGYEKAIADIHSKHPGLKGVYDVKVDTRHLSVLGIYRKQCVEVTARGYQ